MGALENRQLPYLTVLALHALCACSAVVAANLQGFATTKNFSVHITMEKVLHTVNERYLSVALDSSLVRRRWSTFNFTSVRLHTLASGLAPCYLRMGGTEADFLIFHPPTAKASPSRQNFTMSGQDWDLINRFSKLVGWEMVFDFNVLLRNGSDWDDSNARQLLDYSIKKGYNKHLNFQLGNEPNAFEHALNVSLSPTQLGQDFQRLRTLLNHMPYADYHGKSIVMGPDVTNPSGARLRDPFQGSLLLGPDVTRPRDVDGWESETIEEDATEYLKEYLKAVNHSIDAVSWHQYYFDGKTAKRDQFLNASTMDVLSRQITAVYDVMDETGYSDTKMWLSETSSAYGGGAPGLSDRYLAGFLWLDKLGVAASRGIDVVVRQTFYSGSYSLIDRDLQPLPDYWLSVIYKTLVGNRVLKVQTDDKHHKLRVYAHCTNTERSDYPSGSITLYALNIHHMMVGIQLPALLQAKTKQQYLLTPSGEDGIKSESVALNGRKLELQDDTTLPHFQSVMIPPDTPPALPAHTFGFWVIPEARAAACA